ncbi:unnamed protein product [Phytophthora fragariaefolia]|uniref:Unnamed protein product n=1 Tax=Phytophthora fragariaefolia TaxID=1490495 RepID=A0A9W6Y308_9STRA|nr:unnamed protein product [Phytophthora fragariaefolia]
MLGRSSVLTLVPDDNTGGDELLTGLTPDYARTDGDELLTGLASTNAETDTVDETSSVPQQCDQSGTVGSQSCTVGAESEPLQTLPTATEETQFVIASPPRSRGRPKTSAKAKKAAKRPSTWRKKALSSSLPPTKPIIPPASITRMLRPEQIRLCYQKVTALQSEHKTLAENDLAVNIPGFVVFSTRTLRTMQLWHKATKAANLVDKLLKWVQTIDFTIPMPTPSQVHEQPDLMSKANTIPLLSRKAEVLDLVRKTCLSDDTINIVMAKLFGGRRDVTIVDPSIIGSVEGGHMPGVTAVLADVFANVTSGKILIPVCCSKTHWCGIILDLDMKNVCIYDPMKSSYTVRVRALAESLIVQLPDYAPRNCPLAAPNPEPKASLKSPSHRQHTSIFICVGSVVLKERLALKMAMSIQHLGFLSQQHQFLAIINRTFKTRAS